MLTKFNKKAVSLLTATLMCGSTVIAPAITTFAASAGEAAGMETYTVTAASGFNVIDNGHTENDRNDVILTEYTGASMDVTVPATVNNQEVTMIDHNAFRVQATEGGEGLFLSVALVTTGDSITNNALTRRGTGNAIGSDLKETSAVRFPSAQVDTADVARSIVGGFTVDEEDVNDILSANPAAPATPTFARLSIDEVRREVIADRAAGTSHIYYRIMSWLPITSLTLPDTCLDGEAATNTGWSNTEIDTRYDFADCTTLKKVDLSATRITRLASHWDVGTAPDAEGAFEGCTSLEIVSLPAKLVAMGQRAFLNTALTSITIPPSFRFFAPSNAQSHAIGYTLGANGFETVPDFIVYGYEYSAANEYVKDNPGLSFSSQGIYPDVTDTDWYVDAVGWASATGLMTGYEDGSFHPADNLERGQFATILYRLENEPTVASEKVFPDIDTGAFYIKGVNWAKGSNVITGYENGNFGPSDSITREQLVTMMFRYAKMKGYNTDARTDLKGTFSDAGDVTDFAEEAMRWAVAEGIVSGEADGTLNPQGLSSRAVAATILQRFVNNVE